MDSFLASMEWMTISVLAVDRQTLVVCLMACLWCWLWFGRRSGQQNQDIAKGKKKLAVAAPSWLNGGKRIPEAQLRREDFGWWLWLLPKKIAIPIAFGRNSADFCRIQKKLVGPVFTADCIYELLFCVCVSLFSN